MGNQHAPPFSTYRDEPPAPVLDDRNRAERQPTPMGPYGFFDAEAFFLSSGFSYFEMSLVTQSAA